MTDKKKREEEARRKRIENAKKAPPPMDFNSLLKTANEKKDIPVRIEKKVEKKKDSEFGDRPMTKSEKKRRGGWFSRFCGREAKVPKVAQTSYEFSRAQEGPNLRKH